MRESVEEEELIRNDTFIECVVVPPDKLRHLKNDSGLQSGGSREHSFEDFGKDENEKVEEKIQMWILSGGDAEVVSAFKKKRFLQKSLTDLFRNKKPLPDGMSIHFANTEINRLNKKYSRQFKDLLGVKNTSDVVRSGMARNRTTANILLGQGPSATQREGGETGEFSYIDENHIGPDADPHYGILDEDGEDMRNLFDTPKPDGQSDDDDGDGYGDSELGRILQKIYGDGPSPISARTRSSMKKYQTGKGSKKRRKQKIVTRLVPSFRHNKVWYSVS